MKRQKSGILILLSMLTIGLFAQNNVKEDTFSYDISLEISFGGQLLLNNIQLADASKITVSADSTVTLKILPNTGYEISSLEFNGNNVKSQIVNNQFTTPAINAGSTLRVVFKIKQFRLSVNTGNGGGFILLCDYGSTPSFDVTPPSGKVIASVLFNNDDITSTVVDGVCTVPFITTNSTLIVSYADISTSINNFDNKIEKVYAHDSNLIIENSNEGDIINIYSLLGKQINSIKSNGNKISVSLQKNIVYIVKTNLKSYKIIL